MKKFVLLAMLLFSICTMAQKPVEYSEVISVEGIKADQIYKISKKWFVFKFKDAKSVIQLDSPTDNNIVGKAFFPFEYRSLTWSSASGCIWCVIDIKAKDGRFKISVSDFRHESFASSFAKEWSLGLIYDAYLPEYKHQHKKIWDKVNPICQVNYQDIISSFNKFVQENKEVKEENW